MKALYLQKNTWSSNEVAERSSFVLERSSFSFRRIFLVPTRWRGNPFSTHQRYVKTGRWRVNAINLSFFKRATIKDCPYMT
jgi:hypothetical protein